MGDSPDGIDNTIEDVISSCNKDVEEDTRMGGAVRLIGTMKLMKDQAELAGSEEPEKFNRKTRSTRKIALEGKADLLLKSAVSTLTFFWAENPVGPPTVDVYPSGRHAVEKLAGPCGQHFKEFWNKHTSSQQCQCSNSKASEALSSIGIRLQQLDFQAPELDNNNMERQNIVEHSTLEEARPEVGTAANGTGTVLPGCSEPEQKKGSTDENTSSAMKKLPQRKAAQQRVPKNNGTLNPRTVKVLPSLEREQRNQQDFNSETERIARQILEEAGMDAVTVDCTVLSGCSYNQLEECATNQLPMVAAQVSRSKKGAAQKKTYEKQNQKLKEASSVPGRRTNESGITKTTTLTAKPDVSEEKQMLQRKKLTSKAQVSDSTSPSDTPTTHSQKSSKTIREKIGLVDRNQHNVLQIQKDRKRVFVYEDSEEEEPDKVQQKKKRLRLAEPSIKK